MITQIATRPTGNSGVMRLKMRYKLDAIWDLLLRDLQQVLLQDSLRLSRHLRLHPLLHAALGTSILASGSEQKHALHGSLMECRLS